MFRRSRSSSTTQLTGAQPKLLEIRTKKKERKGKGRGGEGRGRGRGTGWDGTGQDGTGQNGTGKRFFLPSLTQSLGPTWWKERTDSFGLSLTSTRTPCMYAHIQRHTPKRCKNVKTLFKDG
jgi:hypothetical protein